MSGGLTTDNYVVQSHILQIIRHRATALLFGALRCVAPAPDPSAVHRTLRTMCTQHVHALRNPTLCFYVHALNGVNGAYAECGRAHIHIRMLLLSACVVHVSGVRMEVCVCVSGMRCEVRSRATRIRSMLCGAKKSDAYVRR